MYTIQFDLRIEFQFKFFLVDFSYDSKVFLIMRKHILIFWHYNLWKSLNSRWKLREKGEFLSKPCVRRFSKCWLMKMAQLIYYLQLKIICNFMFYFSFILLSVGKFYGLICRIFKLERQFPKKGLLQVSSFNFYEF